MSGLLNISGIGGASPNYTLTVPSSAGVVAGDHVVAPKLADSAHGAIYRVLSVPDGISIAVKDDINPAGGIYGSPTTGRGAYWTPTTNGISTAKSNNTPFWGDVTERDLLVLEWGASNSERTGVLIPGDFAGNPKKATVTFLVAYPNTNYVITADIATINDKVFGHTLESKAAGSFVINLSTNNIANLTEVLWRTKAY